jgi:transposase-like protein
MVTDKLRSYHVAIKMIGLSAEHIDNKRSNNRAENSHQPVGEDDEKCKGFNRPDLLRNFSIFNPPLTTHTTSNAIYSSEPHSNNTVPKLSKSGKVRALPLE